MLLLIVNLEDFKIDDLHIIKLPEKIINRKNKYIKEYDKKITILSYLLKKHLFFLLKKHYNFKIKYNKYHKPHLIDSELNKINFNISHHINYIILVYDNNEEIGIDLIDSKVKCNINNLKKIFHKKEKNLLANINNDIIKKKIFCRMWCFKEAYLKFIGTGIQTRDDLTTNYLIPKIDNRLEIINNRITLIKDSIEEKYTINKCNIIELILDKINYICITKKKEMLIDNINISYIKYIHELL
jgi:phosphopantetheinyl transferase